MNRAERAAEARRLRAQGLLYREIAERIGISVSYAGELCDDPEGKKIAERKESYRRPCVDCGVLLNGNAGFEGKRTPIRCNACWGILRTVWTEETVVASIRRFYERYGYAPTATDFSPPQARAAGRPEVAERFYRDGDYPPLFSVQTVFGRNYWTKAIAAAGFTPIPPGCHLADFTPEKRAEAVALYQSGLSAGTVAKRIGCAPESVYRWLREAGVPRRSPYSYRVAA